MDDLTKTLVVAFAAATYSSLLTYYLVKKHIASRLKRLRSEDAMTGLLGYGALDEVIAAKMAKARNNGNSPVPISLILLDIDDFKKLNNHRIKNGDRLVSEVASLLRANVRGADDAIFRYRIGDEFLLLCYGATGTVARQGVGARLSELIQKHAFYLSPSDEPTYITVSMGVSECRPDERFDQIEPRLEDALKKAKENKGSVVLWESSAAP